LLLNAPNSQSSEIDVGMLTIMPLSELDKIYQNKDKSIHPKKTTFEILTVIPSTLDLLIVFMMT